VKIAQFLAAGCEVTILIADIHAFLDNQVGFGTLIKDSLGLTM
jgi:tyrosyl-tRNA synthetase